MERYLRIVQKAVSHSHQMTIWCWKTE